MMKKFFWLCVAIAFVAVATTLALAKPPTKEMNKEHADKNQAGVVDTAEIAQFKGKRLGWFKEKIPVNTPLENKYDANADGILEPAEIKQMVQDRHELVKKEGKVKVNTPLEEQYDMNNDGLIDEKEAKEMLFDSQQE